MTRVAELAQQYKSSDSSPIRATVTNSWCGSEKHKTQSRGDEERHKSSEWKGRQKESRLFSVLLKYRNKVCHCVCHEYIIRIYNLEKEMSSAKQCVREDKEVCRSRERWHTQLRQPLLSTNLASAPEIFFEETLLPTFHHTGQSLSSAPASNI